MGLFSSKSTQLAYEAGATDNAAATVGSDSPITRAGDFSDVQGGASSRAQDEATLTQLGERAQLGGIQLSPYGSNITNSPTTINTGLDATTVRGLLSDTLAAGQKQIEAVAAQTSAELEVLKELAAQQSDAESGSPENIKYVAIFAILGLLGLGWLLTRR